MITNIPETASATLKMKKGA